MVCSSQNNLPHLRQLTLPFTTPRGFPHAGSKQASLLEDRCQCVLVTASSGSGLEISEIAAPLDVGMRGAGVAFDSKTSRPLSFWLSTATGWNRFAFTTCFRNQFLTSSCSTSSRSLWSSSRCLVNVKVVPMLKDLQSNLLSWSKVTCIVLAQRSSHKPGAFLRYHILVANWADECWACSCRSRVTPIG